MIRKPGDGEKPVPATGEFVPEGWEPYTERDKVIEWRTSQLLRAGLTELVADKLARSTSDLHRMCKSAPLLTEEQMLDIFT